MLDLFDLFIFSLTFYIYPKCIIYITLQRHNFQHPPVYINQKLSVNNYFYQNYAIDISYTHFIKRDQMFQYKTVMCPSYLSHPPPLKHQVLCRVASMWCLIIFFIKRFFHTHMLFNGIKWFSTGACIKQTYISSLPLDHQVLNIKTILYIHVIYQNNFIHSFLYHLIRFILKT